MSKKKKNNPNHDNINEELHVRFPSGTKVIEKKNGTEGIVTGIKKSINKLKVNLANGRQVQIRETDIEKR